MEVEHCIRGDGEEIRNFVHHIKRRVDKGWPDDVNGINAAQQNADCEARRRQRKRRYIDCSLKRLRPSHPQQKALEYPMENLNATWNDFSTRIIQTDVSFQVSSNFRRRRTDQFPNGHTGAEIEKHKTGTTTTPG